MNLSGTVGTMHYYPANAFNIWEKLFSSKDFDEKAKRISYTDFIVRIIGDLKEKAYFSNFRTTA